MYSQLVDYSTRMSTRIPYNVANNNVLAITYAVTTAASGDITEEINCCVYCLPLMFGSPERAFTMGSWLSQYPLRVLKFAVFGYKKLLRDQKLMEQRE